MEKNIVLNDYYLLGANVGESYSEYIHNAFGNESYKLLPINVSEFESIMQKGHFKGLNITAPYKELAIKFMNVLDPIAEATNSTNLIIRENDKLLGYNSDYYGLKYLLEKNNILLKDQVVAILGSGGSAKTIAYLAKNSDAKEIYIVSRKPKNEEISYRDLANIKATILFNATPLGQAPNYEKPDLDFAKLTSLKVVIDLNYNPFRNFLMQEAQSQGIKAIGGLEMLVEQARISEELFQDKKFNQSLNKDIVRFLKSSMNICLIGMPYSGKTTVGHQLAKLMEREFIDVDAMIEEQEKMAISEIFAKKGEEYFRQVEKNLIREISLNHDLIISVGGGAVLDEQNMQFLRLNSLVFLLTRPIENITFSNDRPTCLNHFDYEKLWQERQDKYNKFADVVLENATTKEEVTEKVKEKFYEIISD